MEAKSNGKATPEAGPSSRILKRNLLLLARREATAKRHRSWPERVGDRVTQAAGQFWFTCLHAVWFGSWILMNLGLTRRLRAFDPFPFSFLTFVVSLEAIFLSLIILMSQSREMRQEEARAKLDLQINLLTERETTKTLELVHALCAKQGLAQADDPEVQDLLQPVEPDQLLDKLEGNAETAKGSGNS
jgi:uncharacterized membrane protein